MSEHDLFLKEPVPITHQGAIVDWILFATPDFSVDDRLEAVRLAIAARLYHNIDYSHA
jgi:hypothetical protein